MNSPADRGLHPVPEVRRPPLRWAPEPQRPLEGREAPGGPEDPGPPAEKQITSSRCAETKGPSPSGSGPPQRTRPESVAPDPSMSKNVCGGKRETLESVERGQKGVCGATYRPVPGAGSRRSRGASGSRLTLSEVTLETTHIVTLNELRMLSLSTKHLHHDLLAPGSRRSRTPRYPWRSDGTLKKQIQNRVSEPGQSLRTRSAQQEQEETHSAAVLSRVALEEENRPSVRDS